MNLISEVSCLPISTGMIDLPLGLELPYTQFMTIDKELLYISKCDNIITLDRNLVSEIIKSSLPLSQVLTELNPADKSDLVHVITCYPYLLFRQMINIYPKKECHIPQPKIKL